MRREPHAPHTEAKNRRDEILTGTPTSGGVTQGFNIEAESSQGLASPGQRGTHLQTLKGKQVSFKRGSRTV